MTVVCMHQAFNQNKPFLRLQNFQIFRKYQKKDGAVHEAN